MAAGRVSDDAEVHRAPQDVFMDSICPAVVEVNVDLGIGPQEAAQRRRQLVETDAVYGGDGETATDHVSELPQPSFHLQIALDDLFARLVKDLAGGIYLDLAAYAFDQLLVVFRLERPDLLAHRRLGDEILRGGCREALRLYHVAKYFERLDLHVIRSG